MVERHLIIDHLKFSYEGLFNADELYSVISGFFYDRGWDWYEKLNQVQITPSGKQVRILLEPWKNISDYYKISAIISLNITDMKNVEVEHDNQVLQLNQGEIRMIFDAHVTSDRYGHWSKKPFLWFLSIVFEKYFFRNHYQKAENWIKSDIEDLHQQIKNYLNTFKYAYGR